MDLINDHENYEDDSLEDEQDVIEIPESPMTVDMNNDNYSIRDCFVSKQQEMKNSLFTNVSDHPGLPSDIIVIDQPGKIIDKRNRIRMKSSTFGRMKFKDFKQAKKKIESEKSFIKSVNNVCSMSVTKNMKKVKNTLAVLMSNFDKMDHHSTSTRQDESISENLLKTNETIIQSPQMLAENSFFSNESNHLSESNSSDSIESEQILSSISSNQMNHNDFNHNESISRPLVSANESILDYHSIDDDDDYDAPTILADKTIDPNQSQFNETTLLENSSNIINETIIMDDDSLDSTSSSSTGDKCPISSAVTTNENIQPKSSRDDFFNQHDDDDNDTGEIKLKVFKDKKSAKIKQTEGEQNVQPIIERDYQCDGLFRLLCHNCQNYYGSRQLSVTKLHSLLDDCAKHRGYRSAYRSPPRFWDMDFIDNGTNSINDEQTKKRITKIERKNLK
ncbi:uncharacterized protein LOC124497068 [Dermatophagoides farinae]|uniref:uncharacterized protein LOC124497068 n=1 Tax=Dermatophagoides farinae TaxID=6954 RepID=UPI003F634B45